MKHIAHFFYMATLVACLLVSWSPSGVGQTDDTGGADIVTEVDPPRLFYDLELSSEGVVAFDSAGDQWFYDFALDQFVPDESAQDRSGDSRENGAGDEVVEPAETRCVEPKLVDYPALKAVYVGQDEYVDGDILAFGRVRIKGWVKGSVQSFNKAVLVTSTGRVDGDIKAPEITVKPGGIVLGEIVESPQIDIQIDRFDDQLATEGIWVVFGFTLALGLLVFLTTSLAPRQTTNMIDCARDYPTRSLLLGFLFLLLLPAIIVLVAITIVGLAVVPIAYLICLALGMAVCGSRLAVPLVRRQLGLELGPVAMSLTGVMLHMALWTIVALLLGASYGGNSGYHVFGVILLVIAIMFSSYSFLIGIGAAVLTRFGFRPYLGRTDSQAPPTSVAPTPAPPPIPDGPGGRPLTPPKSPGDNGPI